MEREEQAQGDSDSPSSSSSLILDKEDVSDAVQLSVLPDEILEFIMTYLPPYKDLKNCSLVCKHWHSVVKGLVRRSKINLHKGLLDFRLRWEVYKQHTNSSIEVPAKSGPCSFHTSPTSPFSPPLPTIAGRFSHSSVRHGHAMYVFGGGSSSETTFNDLWRFDLSEMRWERPLSMGTYPSPKGSASMVCWQDQLVLFGGWRYPSLHPPYQPWCLFDELHYYCIDSQRWTVHVAVPSPPPMAGHSASVHGDRMVVFGGYIVSGVNSNSNETWCLDLREHRWWQPRLMGNVKPPPRYGQIQLELDDDHLMVVGGCGGPNSIYSDAWLLDMSHDIWTWRSIPIRNKKFGATHMWCNPACKVDSKLVVLGPTPNMPQDFQMMKQTRVPVGGGMPAPRLGALHNNHNNMLDRQRHGVALGGAVGGVGVLRVPFNHNRLENFRMNGGGGGEAGANGGHLPQGPGDQYFANRRAILNQHQQSANNNFFNNNNNNNSGSSNNNLQPRTGRLRDLHGSLGRANADSGIEERNQNRPSSSTAAGVSPRLNGAHTSHDNEVFGNGTNGSASNPLAPVSNNLSDIEAAHRLQRNLALRCRDNEPQLPKRFDELYEDPFRMAAFNVQSRPRSLSKDHNERIRRMEEKMNAIRNSRRNAMIEQKKSVKEPSPKRIKRNVFSLFVCDLSAAMDAHDPHLQWVEYKDYGILPGAPERLILSTMVAGHGELILFGGVHKETLSEISHQVSNTLHFLSAPRDIV